MLLLLLKAATVFSLLFALAQSFGFIKIKKSKVNIYWFFIALLVFILVESLLFFLKISELKSILIYFPMAIAFWINLMKFTLGRIQRGEITLFNRFEHFMGGILIFYAFAVLRILEYFPVPQYTIWFEGFIYFLFTNLTSILNELFELGIDVKLGRKYMIGPEVTDTNFDLLSTFLGSLLGLIAFILIFS